MLARRLIQSPVLLTMRLTSLVVFVLRRCFVVDIRDSGLRSTCIEGVGLLVVIIAAIFLEILLVRLDLVDLVFDLLNLATHLVATAVGAGVARRLRVTVCVLLSRLHVVMRRRLRVGDLREMILILVFKPLAFIVVFFVCLLTDTCRAPFL